MDFNSAKHNNGSSAMDPETRIKKLSDAADIPFDHCVPVKRYFRSGIEMVRLADVYFSEGNLEDAYLLLMRFMILFLDKIQEHPDFKSKNFAVDDYKNIRDKLRVVVPRAEELKNNILQQYKEEYQAHLQDLQQRQEEQQRKLKAQQRTLPPAAPTIPPQSNLQEKKPQSGFSDLANKVAIVPALPDDDILYPSPVSVEVPSSKPIFDRSNKPVSLLSSNHNMRHSLRPVIVPAKLIDKFLNLAKSNTVNNKETCGILAGKLSHDKLVITHLLVPEQSGTPDSCTTQNEEALFAFQDKFDLITLGWIHTHPTQTAFLSSVDLHTHCSYQLMMPEALAIVCAPRYDNFRCFCLTHDYGLRFIANCPTKNGFHPHPNEPPLFMVAEHSIIDDKSFVDVIDLRKK